MAKDKNTKLVVVDESTQNLVEINNSNKLLDADSKYLISLSNTYQFENKSYTELDLSGLEGLTTVDLNAIEKMFYSGGNIAPINEMSIAYTSMVAARASQLPVEFFEHLKANDAVKVKNVVSNFLLN